MNPRARPAISSLPWLPEPPDDFAIQCRACGDATSAGAEIQRLASFRLSAQQSLKLSRTIARCRNSGANLEPLSGFRLGVLASSTFDLLLDCVPAAAARHGVAVEVLAAPYDQVLQEALNAGSEINTAGLDGVLIAVDHRWMHLDRPDFSESPAARVKSAVGKLGMAVEALRRHGGAPAILQTMPVPAQALFGSYERRVRGSVRSMIEDANRLIVALAEESGSYLLDVAALAERVGTEFWFDPVQWTAYKLPFSADCFPIYADVLGRLLGAIRGRARKCLVLDLDNTLWGGVIGDDGLEGIVLGQGTARGESFLSVQELAADLRMRGVVLAVCSKNNDEVARGPFRDHPEMILREEHITVFQANWIDKASNLESIAKTLNIGVDALVLLDDNPAERAQVRAALPMVAVPELPTDPAWYAWTLHAAGYFEAVGYSAEDRLRVDSYGANALRAEVMAKARDLGDYLSSLEMVLTVSPFDRTGRQRIAQLINKSNQFNLTTRRYTEGEVAAMETDPDLLTLQVRLEDKFGDFGMIGVVICRPDTGKGAWDIDTWLMSCRVLGRRIEEGMLEKVVAELSRRGGASLRGQYIPTAKNGMVKDHYSKLGFSLVSEDAEGCRSFELPLAGFVRADLPFRVVDNYSEASDLR
ncbi:MAG TPA: HAD-IIIC family phosphatase [Rhizomicrobium sp.]|jgi:FkbH-like protein